MCGCQKTSECRRTEICDGCDCVLGNDASPRNPAGCDHCDPGIPCDPTTGACIKGMANFTQTMLNCFLIIFYNN